MVRQMVTVLGMLALAILIEVPAQGQTRVGETGAAADEPSAALDQQLGGRQSGGQGPLRGTELIGANVEDRQGNAVGTVGDLILSDRGDVLYLMLSRGGLFGIGNEMVPVPWDKVSTGADQTLTLSVTGQDLEDAPSFSKSDWGQTETADFEQQVRSYYEKAAQPPANEPMPPGRQRKK